MAYSRRSRVFYWISATIILIVAIAAFWFSRNTVERRLYPFLYRDEIVTYAQRTGLDPLFVASIIKNESRFNPDAISRSGAVGLMQVMPDTGRWVAQQIGLAGFDPEMLRDPATNIMIGTWYLDELKREFGGKIVLVVAAYNCGRGKVRAWALENGVDLGPNAEAEIGVWPGRNVTEDFPVSAIKIRETRNYVRGVLGALRRYRELYGERSGYWEWAGSGG
jgi:soluble lytic murein transglycosylase